MFNSLNKGISTFKGVLIIVSVTIIAGAGILAYQYLWLPETEPVVSQEGGKGISPWYSTGCEEYSIKGEDLPSINTTNWQIREHRYNYSFKYPSDTYEWGYSAGTCEDRQEINPSQKCEQKGEPEDPDSVSLSQLDIVKKKQDEIPAWYPTESPYYPPHEICGYKNGIMGISVYQNSAKLGLSDLCEKYNIGCCSTSPNYEIGGVPAIKCTQKCIGVYQVEEDLDWLSPENKKWLEENGYKTGDEVKCEDVPFIIDSVVVLYGDYRYVISSDVDKQDEEDQAIFEGILSTFKFIEEGKKETYINIIQPESNQTIMSPFNLKGEVKVYEEIMDNKLFIEILDENGIKLFPNMSRFEENYKNSYFSISDIKSEKENFNLEIFYFQPSSKKGTIRIYAYTPTEGFIPSEGVSKSWSPKYLLNVPVVFGEDLLSIPSDWGYYFNPEADFTFRYPNNWEIIDDYFYETAGGEKSEQRTVNLKRTDSSGGVSINERQFPCEYGECISVDDNIIGTLSEDDEILDIFKKVVSSFRINKGND